MSAGPDTFPSRRIPLVELRRDGGTQVRAEMNAETVENYVAVLRSDEPLPPVTVFFDGEAYWLADGFHRVAAHQQIGHADIRAEVRQGTREDALWFALAANSKHGLPMSTEDKRKAVRLALTTWPDKTSRGIARHIGVSPQTVTKIREEECAGAQSEHLRTPKHGLDGKRYSAPGESADKVREFLAANPGCDESNRAIAEHLGISDNTVAKVRRESAAPTPAKTPGQIAEEKIRAATTLGELDAAYQEASRAGLSDRECEAVADARQERGAELRAQTHTTAPAPAPAAAQPAPVEVSVPMAPPAPPPTPPPTPPRGQVDLFTQSSVAVCTQEPASQPVSAETVTVSKAEWDTLQAEVAGSRQWQATISQVAGTADSAIAERVIRLIALASSPNEHEAASAALKACRMIRERGLFVATSAQNTSVSGVGSSDIIEALRKESVEFWADMARQVKDAIQRRA